ncbi:MAG: NAD(P)-binding domain-containing protein [Euryarchaeota archaeon]|nr:NAD(P)-binding domain-containing protein [Euryarchaeota archaeon]MDE1837125.1 NAD(P)-binding domain-containing protein [Euryarchaeota archaeon]MDE1879663.1 NAD(P)-binding domain-containing protein [Euryarchaeota archaeon]MDE2045189.1 NAD(P)-binding domain-containing protein [Thermoplasmata archaeon]
MKVGILGSGDVARALGRGFASRGHDVMLGSREPESEKLRTWKKEVGGRGSTGTSEQAATHGEMILVCVHGTGAEEAVSTAGPDHFQGKVVIDTTNPLDTSRGFPPGLFVGITDSLGERLQRKLPGAKLVKAFNTISSVQMVDPKFPGGAPELMICGNDAGAKARVTEVAKELGWPGTLDLGGIEASRWMEAFVPLWVTVGMKLNTWHHAAKWVHP